MAVRPVAGRGVSGSTVAMIALSFVAALAVGLYIFGLTQLKELQDGKEQAERRLTSFGEPPEYYRTEAGNRKTSVSEVISRDLKELGKLTVGAPEAVAASIAEASQTALSKVATDHPDTVGPTDTLLGAITRLATLYGEQKTKADEAVSRLTDANGEVEALTAQLKSVREEFETQVQTLSTQVRQLEEEKLAQLGEKDKQLTELQATLDAREQQVQQLRREGSQTERTKDIEIVRQGNQIKNLQSLIKDLKPDTFDPESILRKADGKVLRAVPGSDVCYIDIGRRDLAKVGMGFAIFSQTRETPRNLTGKARIEIVTLMEDTAECRIIETTPNQPILEGDIVVNIAFERGRKSKFVVAGSFDLNYDGIIDDDGPDKVAALIRQWGGQIVEELDETADYVLVGVAPVSPATRTGQVPSRIVQAQAEKQALATTQFRQLIDKAQGMYIPVITQTQFLYLMGEAYRQNGSVR